MIVRRAQPGESRAVSAWIRERHYSKSTPPGYVCALEFLEGREVVGAMLLGRPASRAYDADLILELTRVYFVGAVRTDEAAERRRRLAVEGEPDCGP